MSGAPAPACIRFAAQNNVQGASDAGLIPMVLPDYAKVSDPAVRERFEALWGFAIDPQPGLTVVEIIEAIHREEIRAMYIMGENPAMSDPDVAHAREALAALDHLVVQDIFLTETAMFADIILPASAWPGEDRDGDEYQPPGPDGPPGPAAARRRARGSRHHHRSRPPSRAGLGLYPSARGLRRDGAGDAVHGEYQLGAAGARKDAVTYPCPAPDEPGSAIVFGDGFPREGGRGLFVPADVTDPAELPDEAPPAGSHHRAPARATGIPAP